MTCDRAATLPFFAPTGRNQGIGSFDSETEEKGNQNIGELKVVKGDDYFKLNGIENINLLKIDVEGFEKPVLRGLNEIMRHARPIVICELTYNKSNSIRDFEELISLFPENYSFMTFNTRKPDGSKARRRGKRARRSGRYELVEYRELPKSGQDDIVAFPQEREDIVPMTNA